MEYNNTNRGQIWKNEDRKSDSHPHFKGSMDIDGVEYWVSAWTRKPDANPKSPALTFSFKKKEDKQDDQILRLIQYQWLMGLTILYLFDLCL